jgi:hypothetical protein
MLPAFFNLALCETWRDEVDGVTSGGIEQAEADIATGIESEFPSKNEWNLDEELVADIVQPVLYVGGGTTPPELRDPPRHYFCGLVPQTEYAELPGINRTPSDDGQRTLIATTDSNPGPVGLSLSPRGRALREWPGAGPRPAELRPCRSACRRRTSAYR